MSYRDVVAIMMSGEEAQTLRAAGLIADKSEGHVTALHVFAMPETIVGFGPEAMALWPQVLEQTRINAAAVRAKIEAQLKSTPGTHELSILETPASLLGGAVARKALKAQISVMQTPSSELSVAAFEGLLFKSGRPVLLVPPGWTQLTLGRTPMIAWRPTREAARAVADAAPLLADAEKITVLSVGGEEQEEPEILSSLARGGRTVEAVRVAADARAVETVILAEAKARKADLLIMGGYGHARLTEFVLGGVTQTLSRASDIPILMSH